MALEEFDREHRTVWPGRCDLISVGAVLSQGRPCRMPIMPKKDWHDRHLPRGACNFVSYPVPPAPAISRRLRRSQVEMSHPFKTQSHRHPGEGSTVERTATPDAPTS
ncbi:hypothetical protein KVT40_008786 [Elsinoe batatas]|uniref:Uncharacterized protein n=1 Tax=Elsinoe batatas TaxID=2601811 RepID=A0A8K0KV20_9PEZI|nr:hypothetical protein KVT40_008786 [Elsinoe batatas]